MTFRGSTTPLSAPSAAPSGGGKALDIPFFAQDLNPAPVMSIQTGIVPPPATSPPAAVTRPLDVAQKAASLGDVVPIVFCRQVAGVGGVLISPSATEARFQNSATNQVTAFYLLVLGEGLMDSIPVRDVFSGGCRHGSHTQTFNRRAGDWIPENAIVQRSGYTLPNCPQNCGSIGSYPGISTLSFSRQVANGSTLWDRQVHLFIRGGMYVQRLTDQAFGPSDNFADLTNWLLANIGGLNANLIDTAGLTTVARFLSANGLKCDCVLKESINYEELITKWAPYFLVRASRVQGKRGLKPLVPTLEDGSVNTTSSVAVYQFDEDTILLDSFRIEYSDLTQRQPFVAQVMWRQQAEDDIGIIRTVELRYSDTARTNLSIETHDLSEFCTSGMHAARFGAYLLASRVNITHSVTFKARPQAHNVSVSVGDLVRVKLPRASVGVGEAVHDFLYEVVTMGKSLEGVVSYECIHHPVDTLGRSIVAVAVANVPYTAGLVDTTKTGPSCDADAGRATDSTIPAEVYIQVIDPPAPLDPAVEDAVVPSDEVLIGNVPVQGTASGTVTNPDDGLDGYG